MRLNGLPEGIEIVEVATDVVCSTKEKPVYCWSNGIIGGKDLVMSPGSIIIKPAAGYVFEYDMVIDEYRPAKEFPKAKILVIRLKVATEQQEQKIRDAVGRMPDFISIEEEELPSQAPTTEPTIEMLSK